MKCPLHTHQGAAKTTAAHTLSSDVFLLGWTSCIFTDTGSPSHSITVSDMHQADGCYSFSPSCYFAFHTVMCWVFAICQDVWLQILHIRFQMKFQRLVVDEMSHEWSPVASWGMLNMHVTPFTLKWFGIFFFLYTCHVTVATVVKHLDSYRCDIHIACHGLVGGSATQLWLRLSVAVQFHMA